MDGQRRLQYLLLCLGKRHLRDEEIPVLATWDQYEPLAKHKNRGQFEIKVQVLHPIPVFTRFNDHPRLREIKRRITSTNWVHELQVNDRELQNGSQEIIKRGHGREGHPGHA